MNIDALLNIEKKYQLNQIQLNGFAFWTYFRQELEAEIQLCKFSYGEAHTRLKLSTWNKIKARLGTVCYALRYSHIPTGKHEILFLNHERRIWIEDHYECIYTDQLANQYPNSRVLERPYMQMHYRPVYTKNLMYSDNVEIKAMLHLYLHIYFCKKRVEKIKQSMFNLIQPAVDEICRAYQTNFDINKVLDKMVAGYFIYSIKKREFSKLLDKVKPAVIIETVSYHMDCMIINELASQRNIPTIELQHGTTGSEHIAYNYAGEVEIEQFPKYFFLFSKFWLENTRFPIDKIHTKVVGFPYLETRSIAVKEMVNKNNLEEILFISQGPIGKKLSDLAVELHELIDLSKYDIVYKLHPGEYNGWRTRYSKLAKSGIRVVDNNQIDLYSLFASATYQIGVFNSTAIFEGLQFNLKTYIWRQDAFPSFSQLCNQGNACFFDTPKELCHLLSQGQDFAVTENFWESNALVKMQNEIGLILAEQKRGINEKLKTY